PLVAAALRPATVRRHRITPGDRSSSRRHARPPSATTASRPATAARHPATRGALAPRFSPPAPGVLSATRGLPESLVSTNDPFGALFGLLQNRPAGLRSLCPG